MTEQTSKINDLLRSLVESFIDYPASLAINAKEVPGGVFWSMQGHADDQPKLIGKQGAHFRAIRFLLLQLGRATDELYTFKLNEPEKAPRRESSPPKQAEKYDPRPAKELLCQILEALAVGQFVVEIMVEPLARPLIYRFVIYTRDDTDYHDLTVPKSDDGLTMIAALGTIFRAFANKDGVKFVLDVRRP